MNDFTEDDAWQRQQRDKLLIPYYRTLPASYTLTDRDKEQQLRGIDTVLCFYTGRVVTIDEKIVRWKGRVYEAFCLETASCTVEGHEKPGWMFYCEADRLLYCFQREDQGLDCYSIDLPLLQRWFWKCETTFPVFQMQTQNKTKGRVVPILDVIIAGVKLKRFQLEPK